LIAKWHVSFVIAIGFALTFAESVFGEALNDYVSHASCLIRPNNTYKLSIATQGTLSRVDVERADRVQKGQVIAQLESAVEEAQIAAAKVRASTDAIIELKTAVYGATAAKVERQRKLNVIAVSSTQSLEDAQSAAAVAKAEVEQAELDKKLAALEVQRLEATLERRILRAPANGVVTSVDLHPGEFADPTNPVATMSEIDPLKVDLYLPASAYPIVSLGARARVTPREPSGAAAAEAVVATKDPQIDASSDLFLVQLKMPNPDGNILAGVECSIQFQP
jgi:RND family efflux transporter MFP subunit